MSPVRPQRVKFPDSSPPTFLVGGDVMEGGDGADDRCEAESLRLCRALVHYKGSPDPFKGDLLNQKVRDTAKEAVEAMFAPTETPTYSQAPSSIQVRHHAGSLNMGHLFMLHSRLVYL